MRNSFVQQSTAGERFSLYVVNFKRIVKPENSEFSTNKENLSGVELLGARGAISPRSKSMFFFLNYPAR